MSNCISYETIFYGNKPNGIREIRNPLSVMSTYIIPRSLLSDAKKIDGIERPGIYYLICENEENIITEIYVGQTQNGVARLDDHNKNKQFWNKAIMFLANNIAFNSDMISGLEKIGILKAQNSKRYTVSNKVLPKFKIDDVLMSKIDKVFEEILFIMASIGYNMDDSTILKDDKNILHIKNSKINALGTYDGEKFVVLENSEINFSRKVSLDTYNNLRDELLKKGDIIREDDKYILKINLEFRTPSGASDFIIGGSTNGWDQWLTVDDKPIKGIYR